MQREYVKTVRLRSADGKVFSVEIAVIAKMSNVIGTLMEDLDIREETTEEELPLESISGEMLEKIIQWCERNYPRDGDCNRVDEEFEEWNRSFLDVENEVFDSIFRAAAYLDIASLYDLCSNKQAANQNHERGSSTTI